MNHYCRYSYNFNSKTSLFAHHMRTLLRRNNKHQPCKSPSPDLAAKNIIKNTIIEVEDIRSKMKKAEQKQIKFDLESSISQMSPSDNLSVQNKYRHVYEEYNKLKYQNKLLADQNRLLNQQNQRLNLQEERNKSLNQLNHLLLSKNQNEVLRDKIIVLDEEKKRLEKELINEKDKSQQSFKNIEKLRVELLMYKGDKKLAPIGFNDQQSRFIVLSNNILNDSEQKMNKRLQELNFKINRIEMMEKIIKQQHSRIVADSRVNKTPSSVKSYNWANNTTVKMDSRYKQSPSTRQRPQKQPLPLSSSPIERQYKLDESILQKLQQQNINLTEEVKIKNSQIERMKIEKQRMIAIIHDLQLQKKSVKISTPKFKTPQDNIFKKFVTLQESINHNMNHYQQQCEHLQLQNTQIRQQLASLEQAYNIEKRELINKIEYLQKYIKNHQEKQVESSPCQQCIKKQEEIKSLKERLKRSQDRFNESLNQLQRKFKSDIEDYQRKLQHSESSGSQKFQSLQEENTRIKQFNSELIVELGNYKMMLQFIKAKIHIEQIDQLMKENVTIYSEVQTTVYHEREQYDKCISAYRYNMIEKEQQIMAMDSELQLRNKQMELLRVEVEKLKQINLQLQDHNMSTINTNLKFMGRERVSKGKIFQGNTEKVLDLIRSGEVKLDILYQKINNSISFDIPRSKYI